MEKKDIGKQFCKRKKSSIQKVV